MPSFVRTVLELSYDMMAAVRYGFRSRSKRVLSSITFERSRAYNRDLVSAKSVYCCCTWVSVLHNNIYQICWYVPWYGVRKQAGKQIASLLSCVLSVFWDWLLFFCCLVINPGTRCEHGVGVNRLGSFYWGEGRVSQWSLKIVVVRRETPWNTWVKK